MHFLSLQAPSLTLCLLVSFTLNLQGVQGILLQSTQSLRGSPANRSNLNNSTGGNVHEEVVHAANVTQHSTGKETVFGAHNSTVRASVLMSPSYISCHVQPNGCAVNAQKIALELGPQIVLLFGCSIDIYAVDYFCKAANAPIVGFTRAPGKTKYEPGNLAYCNVGGLILVFSFHPGVSGPPYFKACDDVLLGSCSGPVTWVNSAALIQQSVASVVATFGRAPTAIAVDSSLWDVAAWYLQDGSPPEPYVAGPAHVAHWCHTSYPTLMHAVQMASPTSKLAFRTAPRVEFMAGYGHSMANIDAMNACLRASGQWMPYQVIDYNNLVETLIVQQGGTAATYYDDAFHPGVLPSMIYIDWVLQWVRTLR